jgi:hypothetical protein
MWSCEIGRAADHHVSNRAAEARGPLRVHPSNPRYFTDGTTNADGSAKAIYLTGSHTWANLIDRGPSDPPPVFDFEWYLDFLEKHNHNFIRLWTRHITWYQRYGEQELHATPLAWKRVGRGKALDGKAKFDLTKFEPVYFERLRLRVRAARDRGIYVSIMLFGGYQETGPNWTGNPFHRDNNINGIDGDPNSDGNGSETQTLEKIPGAVAASQKAYVQKVVDTVNDLDNVLFEISNESGGHSKDWQYELIRFIQSYEKTKPKQHPVGMTMADWPPAETRVHLDASPATWVSYYFQSKPQKGDEHFDVSDPFVADGRKISIQDSDHWWVEPIRGDPDFGRAWVWKSFCRGHNPILMEHLPPLSAVLKDLPFQPDDPGYIASRLALGQTRMFAEKMGLAHMTPQPSLASTRYCLANVGREYLVYQPKAAESFSVELKAGTYRIEWFNVTKGAVAGTDSVTSSGGAQRFKAPFQGDAILLLKGL